MSTFNTAGEARTYAAINGINFDNQDDYCEACRAFHVGASHEDEVATECGEVALQGFDTALDCQRPPHADGEHRTVLGTTWGNQ